MRGGRFGPQAATSTNGCSQICMWSRVATTILPCCVAGYSVSNLGELQMPLVVLKEVEEPIIDNNMSMQTMELFKTTTPMSLGIGWLSQIEDFCIVSLSFSDSYSDMVYVTIYGPSRGRPLVQFIGGMLIEGVYSVINMLARCSKLLDPFLGHYCIFALSFLFGDF